MSICQGSRGDDMSRLNRASCLASAFSWTANQWAARTLKLGDELRRELTCEREGSKSKEWYPRLA